MFSKVVAAWKSWRRRVNMCKLAFVNAEIDQLGRDTRNMASTATHWGVALIVQDIYDHNWSILDKRRTALAKKLGLSNQAAPLVRLHTGM